MKKNSGFTLIELLVVVTIIALLASAFLLLVGNSRKAARDSRRKADLKTLQAALDGFYQKHTGYPPNNVSDMDEISNDSSTGFWPSAGRLILVQSEGFVQRLPVDPLNDSTYYYGFHSRCDPGSSGLTGSPSSNPYKGTTSPQAAVVYAHQLEISNDGANDGGNDPVAYELFMGGTTKENANHTQVTCP